MQGIQNPSSSIQRFKFHNLWRMVIALVLITYSVACTHMPSGEKAFESFESCFAANVGLATLGGIGVGVLSAKLVGGATGNASAAKTAGIAAGLAAGTMIAMHAWKKCAAVYNKSEVVTPPTALSSTSSSAARTPALTLGKLDVRVAGTENDPPQPEFSYNFTATNPAAKDIKAKYRHRVEIVRFKMNDKDQMILANNQGEALLDKAGKEIPIEAAARMPRDQLAWEVIAEDGKNDYVEDVVIQQGQGALVRHKLQVPPRAQLPLPLPVPMRYTLTIEADNMSTSRTVDFFILSTANRPKLYASTGNAIGTRSLNTAPSQAATSAATAKTNRMTRLFNTPNRPRKAVGNLTKGTPVSILERTTAIINNRPEDWVNVGGPNGQSGWLPASHLDGAR